MRTSKGKIPYSITNPVALTKCGICEKRLTEIVRAETIASQGYGGNSSSICTNKDCCMYINLSKVPNWRVKHPRSSTSPMVNAVK